MNNTQIKSVALIYLVDRNGNVLINKRLDRRIAPALSETIEANESFLEAAVRGLYEELSLNIHPFRITPINTILKAHTSTSKAIFKPFFLRLNKSDIRNIRPNLDEIKALNLCKLEKALGKSSYKEQVQVLEMFINDLMKRR